VLRPPPIKPAEFMVVRFPPPDSARWPVRRKYPAAPFYPFSLVFPCEFSFFPSKSQGSTLRPVLLWTQVFPSLTVYFDRSSFTLNWLLGFPLPFHTLSNPFLPPLGVRGFYPPCISVLRCTYFPCSPPPHLMFPGARPASLLVHQRPFFRCSLLFLFEVRSPFFGPP